MFRIAEIIMKSSLCETELNEKAGEELSYIVNQCQTSSITFTIQ